MPPKVDPTSFFITKLSADTTDKLIDPGEAAIAGLAIASGPIAQGVIPAASHLAVTSLGPKPIKFKGPMRYNIDKLKGYEDSLKTLTSDAKVLNLFEAQLIPRITEEMLETGKFFIPKEKEYVNKIAPMVDGMLEKYKLPEKGVRLDLGGGSLQNITGPRYRISDKKIQLPWVNESYALHEVGHAAHFSEPGTKLFSKLRGFINGGAALAIPMAYVAGDEIKKMFPGKIDDKAVDFVQKHAPAIAAATWAASDVYPEVQATARAVKYVRDTKGAAAARATLKELLPALGTYVAPIIPAIVGLSLAKKWFFESKKKGIKSREEIEKAASVLSHAKDFGSGLVGGMWDVAAPVGADLSYLAHQFGGQARELFQKPINEFAKDIAVASAKTVKSPEFIAGAIHAGVPTALTAYVMYNTPHGLAFKERKRQIDSRKSNREKLRNDIDRIDSKRKENDITVPVIAGITAAVSGGILTKIFSDLGKIL